MPRGRRTVPWTIPRDRRRAAQRGGFAGTLSRSALGGCGAQKGRLCGVLGYCARSPKAPDERKETLVKRRIFGCATVLVLCCLINGTMLEHAACCPTPPELARMEEQFRALVCPEREQGNWLYSYRILTAPRHTVCATAVRADLSGRRESVYVLWRLENGIWHLVRGARRRLPAPHLQNRRVPQKNSDRVNAG